MKRMTPLWRSKGESLKHGRIHGPRRCAWRFLFLELSLARQRGESHIPSPMKLDFFPTYVRERREKNYQGYNSLSFVADK